MSDDDVDSGAFSGAADETAGEAAVAPKLSSIPPPPLEIISEDDTDWEPAPAPSSRRNEPPPKPPNRGSSPSLRSRQSPHPSHTPSPSTQPPSTTSSPPDGAGASPPRNVVRPPPPKNPPSPTLQSPPPVIEVGEVEDLPIAQEPAQRSVQPMRIISIGAKPQPARPPSVAPTVLRSSSPPPRKEGGADVEPAAGALIMKSAPQLHEPTAFSGGLPVTPLSRADLDMGLPPAPDRPTATDEEEELEVSPDTEELLPESVPAAIHPVRSKPPPPPRRPRAEPPSVVPPSVVDQSVEPQSVEAQSVVPQGMEAQSILVPQDTEAQSVVVPGGMEAQSAEPRSVVPESAEARSGEAQSAQPRVAEPQVAEPRVAEPQDDLDIEVSISDEEEEGAGVADSEVEEVARAEALAVSRDLPGTEESATKEAEERPEEARIEKGIAQQVEAVEEAATAEELDEGDVAPDSDQLLERTRTPEAPLTEAPAADGAVEPQTSVIEGPPTEEKQRKIAPPPPPKRRRPPPAPSERLVAAALEPAKFEATKKPRVKPWWEELFGEDFLRSFVGLTDSQIKSETNFIEDSLGVAKGGVILDLACGIGQHAVELSRRGYAVVGLDLSPLQLALANEHANERGQRINFVQGDMREMGFEETFDAIYCWNTSFGYFEEERNIAVAQNVFRALRPGGSFLLDVVNRDFVVEQQPSSVWFEGDACVCMDDMSVDFITSRLRVKRTMMIDDGRTKECTYSIRIYGLHELGKILHGIGFRVTEASGHRALPGVFMGATSPRVIILAQKPVAE